METIERNISGTPWTDEEAQHYADAHGLTVVAINGHSLWAA